MMHRTSLRWLIGLGLIIATLAAILPAPTDSRADVTVDDQSYLERLLAAVRNHPATRSVANTPARPSDHPSLSVADFDAPTARLVAEGGRDWLRAQSSGPPPAAAITSGDGHPASPWLALVPLIAPLVVALIKTLAPQIPGAALPLICTLLGVVAQAVDAGGLTQAGALTGATLGGAGVALREMVDQLRKLAPTPPPAVGGPPSLIPGLALLLLIFALGCASATQRATDTTTTTVETNRTITVRQRSVDSSVQALGDSKQAISAMTARNTTTTQSIGTDGLSQESSLENLVKLFQLFLEAGRKGAAGGL